MCAMECVNTVSLLSPQHLIREEWEALQQRERAEEERRDKVRQEKEVILTHGSGSTARPSCSIQQLAALLYHVLVGTVA